MLGRPLCLVMGFGAIAVGLLGLIRWWPLTVSFIKAALPLVLLMGGLVAVIAGAVEIRDPASPEEPRKP